jgi:hypothetical protein
MIYRYKYAQKKSELDALKRDLEIERFSDEILNDIFPEW